MPSGRFFPVGLRAPHGRRPWFVERTSGPFLHAPLPCRHRKRGGSKSIVSLPTTRSLDLLDQQIVTYPRLLGWFILMLFYPPWGGASFIIYSHLKSPPAMIVAIGLLSIIDLVMKTWFRRHTHQRNTLSPGQGVRLGAEEFEYSSNRNDKREERAVHT